MYDAQAGRCKLSGTSIRSVRSGDKVMKRTSRAVQLGWFGLMAVGAGYLHVQAQGRAKAEDPAPAGVAPRAVLDKYCVACHNERLKTAGLMLDRMDVGHVGDSAEIWEKVARKFRTH